MITVHGSARRSSRTWPRKLDGSFKIEAVVDHIVHLVEAELARVVPDVVIPRGIPASRSGLVLLQLAAVKLGVVAPRSEAEALLEGITDGQFKWRVEEHLTHGGLTDRDLQRLGDANGLFFSRPMKLDGDPFELHIGPMGPAPQNRPHREHQGRAPVRDYLGRPRTDRVHAGRPGGERTGDAPSGRVDRGVEARGEEGRDVGRDGVRQEVMVAPFECPFAQASPALSPDNPRIGHSLSPGALTSS